MLGGMENEKSPEGLVRADEAAALIGISKTTMMRLWHEGFLDGERSETGYHELWLTLPSVLAYAKRHARIERSRQALKDGRLGDVEFVDDDLLTTGEASVLADVVPQTITNWIRLGLLGGVEFTSGGNARIPFSMIGKITNQKGKPWK